MLRANHSNMSFVSGSVGKVTLPKAWSTSQFRKSPCFDCSKKIQIRNTWPNGITVTSNHLIPSGCHFQGFLRSSKLHCIFAADKPLSSLIARPMKKKRTFKILAPVQHRLWMLYMVYYWQRNYHQGKEPNRIRNWHCFHISWMIRFKGLEGRIFTLSTNFKKAAGTDLWCLSKPCFVTWGCPNLCAWHVRGPAGWRAEARRPWDKQVDFFFLSTEKTISIFHAKVQHCFPKCRSSHNIINS